jgi:hypothetical protein
MPEQKKGLHQQSKSKSIGPAPTVEGESLRSSGSLNYSTKKPDWDYWKKLDLWTLGQAVCLICGCNPERLNADVYPLRYSSRFSSRFFGDDRSKALRKVYELAVTAIEAGKLKTAGPLDHTKDDFHKKIEPRHFIAWAKSKGLFVPEHLEKFKDTFTADEIKPISSLTVSAKFDISQQKQLDYIHDGKLVPYEQAETTPVYPSMTVNAPHPYPTKEDLPVTDSSEPGHRRLNKVERGRLSVEDLYSIYYPEHQVFRLKQKRDLPEYIVEKKVGENNAESYVETAAQRIKEVGFKSRDEIANDPVIKQICKEQNILFEPTLRKKLAPFHVLPKGKPWSKKKPENRS